MLSPMLVVGVLLVVLAVHVAVQWSARAEPERSVGEELRDVRGSYRRWAQERRRRRLPLRPAADEPPAGLAPLVPSPRVVAQEVRRGVRELEDWLAQQASA